MRIAFYKSTRPGWQGWFNRLVRWWTNGPYSHCEAVIMEANGKALCGSSSFLDGGVRLKWIELDAAHWDFLDVPADTRSVLRWYQDHLGCKYDVLGLVRFILRRGDGSRNRYVCGESIANALGCIDGWRFDPNTFYAALTYSLQQKEL